MRNGIGQKWQSNKTETALLGILDITFAVTVWVITLVGVYLLTTSVELNLEHLKNVFPIAYITLLSKNIIVRIFHDYDTWAEAES